MTHAPPITRKPSRRRRVGARATCTQRAGAAAEPHAHSGEMELRLYSPAPGCRLVEVGGEVDFGTAARLGDALACDAGTESMIVDLRRAGFIDVAGIRALERGCDACRRAGCRPSLLLTRGGPTARLLMLLDSCLPEHVPPVLDGVSVHMLGD